MSATPRMIATAAGTASSPDRNDCPGIYRLTGYDDAFVIVRDNADGDAKAALADQYNPTRERVGTQPPWVPCGLMDLSTLGRFMDDHLHRRGDWRFRLEQLPQYSRTSPDFLAWQAGEEPPSSKQHWLNQLAEDEAVGLTHYRVRLLSEELTEYELYACQRGYAANSRYEHIRILRRGEHPIPDLVGPGDYWIVNQIVLPVFYHFDGTFVGGAYIAADDVRATAYHCDAARLWAAAEPWASWWTRHPEYHNARSVQAA